MSAAVVRMMASLGPGRGTGLAQDHFPLLQVGLGGRLARSKFATTLRVPEVLLEPRNQLLQLLLIGPLAVLVANL
jgi:hypothetical protein